MKTPLRSINILFAFAVFLVYTSANILLSQFHVTLFYLPHYFSTVYWGELVVSAILFLAIGVLISMTAALLLERYQEQKRIGTAGAVMGLGTAAGLATGVCSACVAGVAPVVLAAIGVTAGFVALPFRGLEIQLATVILLGVNLYALQNKEKN